MRLFDWYKLTRHAILDGGENFLEESLGIGNIGLDRGFDHGVRDLADNRFQIMFLDVGCFVDGDVLVGVGFGHGGIATLQFGNGRRNGKVADARPLIG